MENNRASLHALEREREGWGWYRTSCEKEMEGEDIDERKTEKRIRKRRLKPVISTVPRRDPYFIYSVASTDFLLTSASSFIIFLIDSSASFLCWFVSSTSFWADWKDQRSIFPSSKINSPYRKFSLEHLLDHMGVLSPFASQIFQISSQFAILCLEETNLREIKDQNEADIGERTFSM